jgi:inner membrane protein
MPSPIAHLGTGYAIYRLSKFKQKKDRPQFRLLVLQGVIVAGLSMLPDLDVLLAIYFGDMANYHNHFTHSLIFGLPVALLCAVILNWTFPASFRKWFLVSLLSYELHIILDMFTGGRGVLLFWPFVSDRFSFPVDLFYGVQWGLGWFSLWHLWTFFTEGLFVLLLVVAVNWIEKRKS